MEKCFCILFRCGGGGSGGGGGSVWYFDGMIQKEEIVRIFAARKRN